MTHAEPIATNPRAAAPAARAIPDALRLLSETLEPERRLVRAGDPIYRAGDRLGCLYVLNSGVFKVVNLTADGREQVVALKFKGDWLGLDGIAGGRHTCDAVAIDTGEVWMLRYGALLDAAQRRPELLQLLLQAMSREIAHDRDALMSMCTLPADARVAEFLRYWADALEQRGLRTEQITLRMTRAEIGNYLGMTLETVSRALSRLARDNVIAFCERGRREVRIPNIAALHGFVQRSLTPASPMLQ